MQVKGFSNLYAMEVDPNLGLSNLPEEDEDGSAMGMGRAVIQVSLSARTSGALV